MKKYQVKWNYKSSLSAQLMKGDVVELDERLAEAIDRDSPGVLEAVEVKTVIVKGKNRMQTEAEKRSDPTDPTREELITKDTFKAVKDK